MSLYTVPAYESVQYDDDDMIQALRDAGFPFNVLDVMRCIGYAESSGSNAIQRGQPYDTTGWGCWQITPGDSVPSVGVDKELLDLDTNARAAFEKWKVQGLGAWSTYKNGAYAKWENFHRDDVAKVTTPTGPGVTPVKWYSMGNSGPGVAELQRVLNAWYPWLCLTLDGKYDSATAEAVASFQKRAGFPVTGVADARTLARLGIR